MQKLKKRAKNQINLAHIQQDTLQSFDVEKKSVIEAKEHLDIFKTIETAQQCEVLNTTELYILSGQSGLVLCYRVFYHNFF